VQWPLAPRGHAPLRSQCHLVFRFINFFTKSSARAASRIVDIVTVFLAALAVLIVNISFSPKTKWHWLRSLAEGSVFVNCARLVAARHRGAEEDFLKRFFLLLTKFGGA
jgi:hypothetical protein